MKHVALKSVAVLAAAAVAGGVGVSIAQADSEVVIRPNDLNTSETRAQGHVDFKPYGLHVWTESNTSLDKAAGYFDLGVPLSTITDSSMIWYGSQPQPGQQIVIDQDGDTSTTNDQGILVGEPVYNGNWWLTNGSAQSLKDSAPHSDCASGSTWCGTLDEWSTQLPDAEAVLGGFSLGSGVKGDGYLESITYGDTTYTFSNEAAPDPTTQAPVTGSYAKSQGTRFIRITMTSDDAPDNTVASQRLKWEVRVDGFTSFLTQQDFGDQDVWAQKFSPRTGRHLVRLFKNDQLVGTWYVAS